MIDNCYVYLIVSIASLPSLILLLLYAFASLICSFLNKVLLLLFLLLLNHLQLLLLGLIEHRERRLIDS